MNEWASSSIQPLSRLQEWIADEKGYFRDVGLDYEFKHGLFDGERQENFGYWDFTELGAKLGVIW